MKKKVDSILHVNEKEKKALSLAIGYYLLRACNDPDGKVLLRRLFVKINSSMEK